MEINVEKSTIHERLSSITQESFYDVCIKSRSITLHVCKHFGFFFIQDVFSHNKVWSEINQLTSS